MTTGPYSRVYWSIQDDSRFAPVLRDDRALGTWLRLLLAADAAYPYRPTAPRPTASTRLLIKAELLIELPDGTYTMRGLKGERDMRSQTARSAAAVRWQGNSTAESMPRRDETRRDETSNGADALREQQPASFIGWKPKPKPGSHEGQHPDCIVCHPELAKAPKASTLSDAKRDELIQSNLALLNDPSTPVMVKRAAETTIAKLRGTDVHT